MKIENNIIVLEKINGGTKFCEQYRREYNGSQYYNKLCVTFVSQHYTHNFRILVISIYFTLSGVSASSL